MTVVAECRCIFVRFRSEKDRHTGVTMNCVSVKMSSDKICTDTIVVADGKIPQTQVVMM